MEWLSDFGSYLSDGLSSAGDWLTSDEKNKGLNNPLLQAVIASGANVAGSIFTNRAQDDVRKEDIAFQKEEAQRQLKLLELQAKYGLIGGGGGGPSAGEKQAALIMQNMQNSQASAQNEMAIASKLGSNAARAYLRGR